MLTQKQIRARIYSLTFHSINRSYLPDLIEREVDENVLLFNTRCQQCQKDPEKMMGLIIKKMQGWPNMAFCQALTFVFELTGYRSYDLNGWNPPDHPVKKTILKRRVK